MIYYPDTCTVCRNVFKNTSFFKKLPEFLTCYAVCSMRSCGTFKMESLDLHSGFQLDCLPW